VEGGSVVHHVKGEIVYGKPSRGECVRGKCLDPLSTPRLRSCVRNSTSPITTAPIQSMLKRTCIDATRTACIVVLGDFDKRRRFICERRYIQRWLDPDLNRYQMTFSVNCLRPASSSCSSYRRRAVFMCESLSTWLATHQPRCFTV